MKRFLQAIAAMAVLIGLMVPARAQVIPQSDLASRGVTVMVFSDDADTETIPRDNRIFNRVIVRLQEAMNLKGFQVYEETATTMNYTAVHKVRRVDAEFLEIARSATPKINVAVIFQIFATTVKGDYSDLARPKVRIGGRMLNVQTGQFIGAFEVSEFPMRPLPLNCADRECLLETVGDYADQLGAALGETLADKLAGFTIPSSPQMVGQPAAVAVPMAAVATPAPVAQAPAVPSVTGCAGMPDTYVIRFRDFDDQQINEFESLLVSFGCYTHHATLRSMRQLVEFTYETSSSDARLSRNLRVALDYAGARGTVSQTGNIFEVTQIRTR